MSTTTHERARVDTRTQLTVRADNLPDGVIGQVRGIALVYGVTDTYETRFRRGSLDRTSREKVAAGKVQLFEALDEHWHQYGTRSHVGVVRSVEDVGDAAVMTADLFDTEAGRRVKEYLTAVTAAGGFTGLSVGVRVRASELIKDGDDTVLEFTEVELVEITVTPMPAVPGAQVTAVRAEPGPVLHRALEGIMAALPEAEVRRAVDAFYGDDAGDDVETEAGLAGDAGAGNADATDSGDAGHPPDSPDARAEDSHVYATMDERVSAVRQSFARGSAPRG